MKLIRDLAVLPDSLRSGAVAIGNFDGLHLGHARIADRLIERAREAGGPAVVFTFDPHPVRLLRPDLAPPPLTWTDRKAELLAALGVDAVIAYPTDKALLNLSPQQFFDSIVRKALDARAVVEGSNFYFGHNRSGTIDVLRRLTAEAGIVLDVVEPMIVAGQVVSSSRVRRLVGEGRVAAARALLTEPYRIRGAVVEGARPRRQNRLSDRQSQTPSTRSCRPRGCMPVGAASTIAFGRPRSTSDRTRRSASKP